jgi:hypothetical protein
MKTYKAYIRVKGRLTNCFVTAKDELGVYIAIQQRFNRAAIVQLVEVKWGFMLSKKRMVIRVVLTVLGFLAFVALINYMVLFVLKWGFMKLTEMFTVWDFARLGLVLTYFSWVLVQQWTY